MWSTGGGNGKPLQYSCCGNPMNRMKRQEDMAMEGEPHRLEGVQYGAGEEWGQLLTAPERTKWLGQSESDAQLWMCLVVKLVWCWKEQYCIGTWNVTSMNQSKLDEVKQEMARVNINILGISELKWMGMCKFNSGDHYIYCCGQESLRRNGVALIVNKSLKCNTWMQSQKWQNDLCSFPRQTIQYHSNPSLCPDQ